MNSGIYTAYSGLKAQSDALEILSNNLANLNTTAFKEETAFYTFLDPSAGVSQQTEDLNGTINKSIRVGSFVNSAEGSLSATKRDLDIAIEGNGFLVVKTPGGIRYTRNGNLNLNAQSVLVASDGFPVIGESGKPITLGPGKITISENGEVSLSEDGAVSSETTPVDRLKIVSFDDLSALKKEGSSLFISRADRSLEKSSDAKIKSGYLEQSNVNPVSSIVRMVEILRHFEAIQKSINLVMNDINSKAIEKLGR
jgi:flagellar basal-body rod protein FlgF